jgi:hypothetical protein
MTDDYRKQVEAAYQGEVYGEAMYAAIAGSISDPEQARKWAVLTRLETRTKADMLAVVSRLGGDTRELASSRERGLQEAQRYIGLPWMELMELFSRELDPVIVEYAELERHCPSEDAVALGRLTRHEVVAKQFCELELQGLGEGSLEPILEFLA